MAGSKLLTVKEIAERLGRSEQAVRWQIHLGTIPTAIVGGRRVAREADLEAWIDAQFEAAS